MPKFLMTKSTREGLADALTPENHLMLTHTQRGTLLRIMDQDFAGWRLSLTLLLGRWSTDLEYRLEPPIGFIRDNPIDMVARGGSVADFPSSADMLGGGTAKFESINGAKTYGGCRSVHRGNQKRRWKVDLSNLDRRLHVEVNKLHLMAVQVGQSLPIYQLIHNDANTYCRKGSAGANNDHRTI